ncbi:MBL fold metallo-hydrolase [Nocardia arizonensis]|uniref:MBL fold metallo-hydrolase n=1 Tax=Nocardia arizonensis TaxID=1141647 RepID=UPI0006CFA060|nr:MBL fold metallo-hydrolase [Nocardia arizonensis]
MPATDPVSSPSLFDCCAAVGGLLTGLVRPRPADQRFLRTITDAGLPNPARTVRITALRQVPRPVPTYGVAEGVLRPRRLANSMTTFVLTHPEARFLVDPAICTDVADRAIAQLPAILRPLVRPPSTTVPTIEALREFADPATVDFALPTHAHWDHVCGLLDLPGLAVRLHRVEHEWVSTGPVAPVGGVRDALRERETTHYDLDGPPVLTFTRSHDLFGDGSVLLVDLAGHTPGSVGVLAHTERGWVLLAGDAAWHRVQIDEIRQKASFPGEFVDVDRDMTFKTLHRLHLARHTVRVVPTHDHDAAVALGTGTDV